MERADVTTFIKQCPNCPRAVLRTATRCECGHEFVGRARRNQMRREAGEVVMRGRNSLATCEPGSVGSNRSAKVLTRTKECPQCHAAVSVMACVCKHCGNQFVSARNKHPDQPRGKTGPKPGSIPSAKSGRKPKFDPDAPETDSAIDRILGAAMGQRAAVANAVPADGGFGVVMTVDALVLSWSRWNVRLELTPGERAVLRKALAN